MQLEEEIRLWNTPIVLMQKDVPHYFRVRTKKIFFPKRDLNWYHIYITEVDRYLNGKAGFDFIYNPETKETQLCRNYKTKPYKELIKEMERLILIGAEEWQ